MKILCHLSENFRVVIFFNGDYCGDRGDGSNCGDVEMW